MQNKRVLLGVTGGIAAYKACDLTSKLTQEGADVRVVMTESATKFVSPLTFQALSRNPVYIDTFDEKDPEKIAHIDLADWAEIAIIAPATANIIAKLALGLGDDMLSTICLASRATTYIAPAMNVHMYQNQAVQKNMFTLTERGYHFIEPGAGYLACGYVGKGRLEEPLEIIKAIKNHQNKEQPLKGKNILISAGPTREELDPVRFFTNRSTGKMGYALAKEALNLGARVTLVSGPTNLIKINGVKTVDVVSAAEMYQVMHDYYEEADIVIKAAAVADYRPKKVSKQKMKKSEGELKIEMERTKDILKSLGKIKKEQILIGFAAETEKHLEYGRKKLESKNLDAIVVNNVSEPGAGFGSDTNIVTFITEDDEIPFTIDSKEAISTGIFKEIMKLMDDLK